MSFRFLYRRIPVSKRICNRCLQPILRNIARDKNGQIYHYGCLQNALDDQWRCEECYLTFDATEATWTEYEDLRNDCNTMKLKPNCPNCGSSFVKPFARHHEMPSGRLVACKPGGS